MIDFVSKYIKQTYDALRCITVALFTICCGITTIAAHSSVIDFPNREAASVAVVIRDLRTGTYLINENPRQAMTPASILKCVTTAAALTDGRDQQIFLTPVRLHGKFSVDGVFYGNLIIDGAGDPTIESRHFPSYNGILDSIASKICQLGIQRIQGDIEVNDSGLPGGGPGRRWEIEDMDYAYGAGLYALNYLDNTAGNSDKALPDPAEAFVSDLEDKLNEYGVYIEWDELDSIANSDIDIYTHKSPKGHEIMHDLMVRSDNLFAEGVLRSLAPGATLKQAIAREKQILQNLGLDTSLTDIYDGSGLTRNNRVTAEFMTELLSTMAKSKKARQYLSFFPKVGREGTVKRLLKSTRLEGKLLLKSGSINGVQCFAGYKTDMNGTPTHTVVIMINDFFCKRDTIRKAISNLLLQQFPQ